MKRLVLLSVLYIYLETGLCSIEEANSDELTDTSLGQHSSIVKRNTAFKRLPAWSVYYGKRSGEQNYNIHKTGKFDNEVRDDFDSIANENLIAENDSESEDEGISKQLMLDYLENKAENNGFRNLDAVKRSNLKRLQPWISSYGKRSGEVLNSGTGFDTDMIEPSSGQNQDSLSQEIYDSNSDFDMDDLQSDNVLNSKHYQGWSTSYDKRAPWSATYGKRAPWSVTYGKRAPWAVTYGKRAPWAVTYGKRAPWAVTYGKRAPWAATYGKRAPWAVTYGKRAPWAATYGKRAPWAATYGKRAPWSVTYGKRAPWTATYGKRSQSWNAFYGKRAPLWQAGYGKRHSDESSLDDDAPVSDIMDSSDESATMADKRGSQAWTAFYGR